MKYNWHIFFKRLTIVVSILIIPIPLIFGDPYAYHFRGPKTFSWELVIMYIVIGCLISIGIWILYFVIHWIIRGLLK